VIWAAWGGGAVFLLLWPVRVQGFLDGPKCLC